MVNADRYITGLGGKKMKVVMDMTNPFKPTCQRCHKACDVVSRYKGVKGTYDQISGCCFWSIYSNIPGEPMITITKDYDNFDQIVGHSWRVTGIEEAALSLCVDFERNHWKENEEDKPGYHNDVNYKLKYKRVLRARNKYLFKINAFEWDEQKTPFFKDYSRETHLPRLIQMLKDKIK